jgi:hypothetical protein
LFTSTCPYIFSRCSRKFGSQQEQQRCLPLLPPRKARALIELTPRESREVARILGFGSITLTARVVHAVMESHAFTDIRKHYPRRFSPRVVHYLLLGTDGLEHGLWAVTKVRETISSEYRGDILVCILNRPYYLSLFCWEYLPMFAPLTSTDNPRDHFEVTVCLHVTISKSTFINLL